MALTWSSGADATIVQQMILKDGTVLKGFIKQQDDANRLVFQADEAMVIAGGNAAISNMREYTLKELGAAWTAWAVEHKAFVGEGDKRVLTLCDVSTNGSSFSKVCLLERGTVVKFYEIGLHEYIVNWSDVARIEADRRSPMQLTGINVTYTKRTGETVTGQYAGETDSTISVYTQVYAKECLRLNDVVKYNYAPQNANQTIFEQSELLDVITTTNGSTWKGVVIENNYNDDINDCTIISVKGGGNVSIKNSDIQNSSKEINPDYACVTDIVLKKDSVVVNRQAIQKVQVQNVGGAFVVLDMPQKGLTIAKAKDGATSVVVEYNYGGSNNEVFKLARAIKQENRKGVTWLINKDALLGSYSSHVGEIVTSVNGTTKAEYQAMEEGLYMLFDVEHKTAIPFLIK